MLYLNYIMNIIYIEYFFSFLSFKRLIHLKTQKIKDNLLEPSMLLKLEACKKRSIINSFFHLNF